MAKLFDTIGSSAYTNLLADPQGADVIAVPCTPAKGIIEPGTVLYRTASGLWEPAAAKDIVDTNQLVVCKETVDTTADAEVAEDAAAYRAGCFIDGVVKVGGAVPTDAQKVVLRGQNIVFDKKETTATFKNDVKA